MVSHYSTYVKVREVVVVVVVVVLGFYVPSTVKVIRRRGPDFKYHPEDWRSQGSNVYKASSLTTTSRRLLDREVFLFDVILLLGTNTA